MWKYVNRMVGIDDSTRIRTLYHGTRKRTYASINKETGVDISSISRIINRHIYIDLPLVEGERPRDPSKAHKCDVCGRVFQSITHLKRHNRTLGIHTHPVRFTVDDSVLARLLTPAIPTEYALVAYDGETAQECYQLAVLSNHPDKGGDADAFAAIRERRAFYKTHPYLFQYDRDAYEATISKHASITSLLLMYNALIESKCKLRLARLNKSESINSLRRTVGRLHRQIAQHHMFNGIPKSLLSHTGDAVKWEYETYGL